MHDKGMAFLTGPLVAAGSLLELRLSADHIGCAGARNISYIVRACKELRTLDVSHNEIPDLGLRKLVSAVKVHLSVRVLDLSWNKFGPSSVSAAATTLCRVTELNLSGNAIGPSGAESLLTHLGCLETLELHGCEFDGLDPDSFSSLNENGSLRRLDLSGICIGPETIQYLCLALSQNWTLRSLNLMYNPVEDAGAGFLAEMLLQNRGLEHLDIRQAKIGCSAAETIRKTCAMKSAFELLL